MFCVNIYYVYPPEVCVICTSLYQQTFIVLQEDIEDTNGVIRIRKSKDRQQHNG